MRRAAQEATLLVTVVVLALVVWFVIADAENREIETRLGFSLQVEVIDLGSNLVIVGDPLPVSVTVVGREDDVESARPEHFKATVSLRNRVAGRHSLPVRVEAVEGDVRVRAVLPETAVVVIQETVEREVPVIVEASNPPPLGFRVGAPEVLPDSAVVSGIASEVEAVDSLVARLDLGGATVSVERSVILEARTAGGGAVTQIVVNPRFAQVRVPIEQELFRRTASVLPDIAGTPAEGFRVRAVRVSPSTVDVLVSVDVLDDETRVLTQPVDISGVDGNVSTAVQLVFADGASAAGDSDTTARVDVLIEPIITSVRLPIVVETFAVRDGLELALARPASVHVTLRGPVVLISGLNGPLEPIRVNLGSFPAGLHQIDLSWTPPDGIELVELSPARLTVTLSPVPPPEPEEPQEPPDGESTDDEESAQGEDDSG
ncbi:MAG: CdaR family protein [Chloroflexota bacterium]|nr:CdaR family protein [Chloroflexota bacterium]MDE2894551.1 CdaR family protein [Chloroflexota bacterium]